MIIGLSGLAGSGKDTVGEIIASMGYERVALAQPVKDMLCKMNPIIWHEPYRGYVRLADHVHNVGWDLAKRSPEVRRLLQEFGTGVGREMIYEDFWIDRLFTHKLPWHLGGSYVITDVRFENEANRIHEVGGVIFWIERPGVEQMNHVSESGIARESADYIITNDGTLDSLRESVVSTVKDAEKGNL